ncbi:hypothetical protein [Helicobacter labetoulli]|uniref:hypothetical protein n=1 Tax=Helicobacter labetoulli TaxID=2315333 RepID=UPI000EF6FB85|nr:hypothetical protein [Helicobacter labetoulli]
MKNKNIFSILFIFLSSFSICFANSTSKVNSMENEVKNLKNIAKDQNNEIEDIVNLGKLILVELKRKIFLIKQKNELILNYWHIKSQIE